MPGSIFVILLLVACLAEGMAEGHPQRATRLGLLRRLIATAWVAWAVQSSWNDTSIAPWLIFGSLAGARLFLLGFLGCILWLWIAGLLKSRWPAHRTGLISANTAVSTLFALIVGATVDWAASSPFVFVFLIVHLVVFAGVTRQLAHPGDRAQRDRLENAQPPA